MTGTQIKRAQCEQAHAHAHAHTHWGVRTPTQSSSLCPPERRMKACLLDSSVCPHCIWPRLIHSRPLTNTSWPTLKAAQSQVMEEVHGQGLKSSSGDPGERSVGFICFWRRGHWRHTRRPCLTENCSIWWHLIISPDWGHRSKADKEHFSLCTFLHRSRCCQFPGHQLGYSEQLSFCQSWKVSTLKIQCLCPSGSIWLCN